MFAAKAAGEAAAAAINGIMNEAFEKRLAAVGASGKPCTNACGI